MGKVIDFSEILLKKAEQPDDRTAILTIAILPEAEEIIEKAGLASVHFFLNKESEIFFKKKPVTYREPDDSFSDIYYDAKTQDVIYRVECKVFLEEDTVSVDTNLYKLEDYRKENREWLWFNENEWQKGPGENYFELDEFGEN